MVDKHLRGQKESRQMRWLQSVSGRSAEAMDTLARSNWVMDLSPLCSSLDVVDGP